MNNNLFNAIKEKFQNDIVDTYQFLEKYQLQDVENNENSVEYFLSKKINIDDLDEKQNDYITQKYFSDFEFEQFDTWWKFNGEEWEEEYKKQNPSVDADNIMIIAFEDYCEKNAIQIWQSFQDYINLKQILSFQLINDYEDKIRIVYKTYIQNDIDDNKLFESIKTKQIYEFHLSQMTETLKKNFNLSDKCSESLLNNYYDDKLAKIASKVFNSSINTDDWKQTPVNIEKVKKGDYLTLKDIPEPKESQVYVMDGYDRSERKYLIYKFDGSGMSRWLKRGTKVYTDFYF